MNAKLEWMQSNAQQNIKQLQNSTMGVTINNESTTTTAESPPQNGQQSKPLGGLNAFTGTKQILDSAVVEARLCKQVIVLPVLLCRAH